MYMDRTRAWVLFGKEKIAQSFELEFQQTADTDPYRQIWTDHVSMKVHCCLKCREGYFIE